MGDCGMCDEVFDIHCCAGRGLERVSLVGGEGRVLDREVDGAFRAMGVVEGM
jgi:hypothetical protein